MAKRVSKLVWMGLPAVTMPANLAHARRPPAVRVRTSARERGDIDALIALEHRVFATDRLSRRSLRRFLKSPSAAVIVAEAAAGSPAPRSCCSGRARRRAPLFASRWRPPMSGRGVGPMLLEAAEAPALARGCRAMRLEVHDDNHAAIARYRKSGYREFGRHRALLRGRRRRAALREAARPDPAALKTAPPYFHQTTEFTCGPACMMMALAWADRRSHPAPAFEFQLWREATTIFMSSGPGGCEPYGMAVALKRRGLGRRSM